MCVNCVNIEREKESLHTKNINILVRFHKTREIFPSTTRVLSIFLTTAAASAILGRVNSKDRVGSIFDSGCQLCTEVRSQQQ